MYTKYVLSALITYGIHKIVPYENLYVQGTPHNALFSFYKLTGVTRNEDCATFV